LRIGTPTTVSPPFTPHDAPDGNSLTERLMRAALVEVAAVLDQDGQGMPLAEDQKVIQEFSAHAAQKPLAHGVGFRRPRGRLDDLRAGTRGCSVEVRPVPVVVITKCGPRPNAVAFRICCATHVDVGVRVTPTYGAALALSAYAERTASHVDALYVGGRARSIRRLSRRDGCARSRRQRRAGSGLWEFPREARA